MYADDNSNKKMLNKKMVQESIEKHLRSCYHSVISDNKEEEEELDELDKMLSRMKNYFSKDESRSKNKNRDERRERGVSNNMEKLVSEQVEKLIKHKLVTNCSQLFHWFKIVSDKVVDNFDFDTLNTLVKQGQMTFPELRRSLHQCVDEVSKKMLNYDGETMQSVIFIGRKLVRF